MSGSAAPRARASTSPASRDVLASEVGAAPSNDLEDAWQATVGHPAHQRARGSSASSLPQEVVRLRAAGDEAMRRPDPAVAAERYAAAATAAARAGAVDAYADLLVDVGQARKQAGDPAGADRALSEAADLARRRSDLVLLGRAALALSGMELITPRVAPDPSS